MQGLSVVENADAPLVLSEPKSGSAKKHGLHRARPTKDARLGRSHGASMVAAARRREQGGRSSSTIASIIR